MHQPTEEFSVHATTSTSTCPTFNSAGWTFVANHRSQAASLHLSLNRPELDLAPRPPGQTSSTGPRDSLFTFYQCQNFVFSREIHSV